MPEAAPAMAAISAAGVGFALVRLARDFVHAPCLAGREPVVLVQHPSRAEQGQPAAEQRKIDGRSTAHTVRLAYRLRRVKVMLIDYRRIQSTKVTEALL